jgi:hypothetical protein
MTRDENESGWWRRSHSTNNASIYKRLTYPYTKLGGGGNIRIVIAVNKQTKIEIVTKTRVQRCLVYTYLLPPELSIWRSSGTQSKFGLKSILKFWEYEGQFSIWYPSYLLVIYIHIGAGIAQWYSSGLRVDHGFESRLGLGILPFATASRRALGPTQLPNQWVPGTLSLGGGGWSWPLTSI